jgi:ribonuclease G
MDNRQHKRDVIEMMKQETAQDEMRVQVIGFTELGILELTRKRTSPSLIEKTTVRCAVCGGSGKVVSPETVAFRLERELLEHRKTDDEAVWVELNQAIADVLLGEKESYRPILEEAIAKKLVLSITNDSIHQYVIKRFGSYQEIIEALRLTT